MIKTKNTLFLIKKFNKIELSLKINLFNNHNKINNSNFMVKKIEIKIIILDSINKLGQLMILLEIPNNKIILLKFKVNIKKDHLVKCKNQPVKHIVL